MKRDPCYFSLDTSPQTYPPRQFPSLFTWCRTFPLPPTPSAGTKRMRSVTGDNPLETTPPEITPYTKNTPEVITTLPPRHSCTSKSWGPEYGLVSVSDNSSPVGWLGLGSELHVVGRLGSQPWVGAGRGLSLGGGYFRYGLSPGRVVSWVVISYNQSDLPLIFASTGWEMT